MEKCNICLTPLDASKGDHMKLKLCNKCDGMDFETRCKDCGKALYDTEGDNMADLLCVSCDHD